ncbi:hypothetical protein [Paenarthrobacter aromaticivorans]|uniref:Uncharacterized protein n=1 Tax=Paenarthrobacter aromaticivorans TaxID=2849150 RepID=A0ABS6I5L3_9MICC|nr:hypothetical protein [Paenarthrobacter sp. MMS21-TAE1-1]MBU8865714.1 hypothetical protein [Paenarthrobacter sp. MMS21-TAE1-1]
MPVAVAVAVVGALAWERAAPGKQFELAIHLYSVCGPVKETQGSNRNERSAPGVV